ncbi:hypothetical protein D9M69_583510 [compost metagenome]
MLAADVENPPGCHARGRVWLFAVPLSVGLRWAVDQACDALDNVVDVGEVPLVLAVVEQLQWPFFGDGPGELDRRHVRPSPGAVHREKA